MSIYTKDPEHPAAVCIIWMHGLGADSSDMANLSQQLYLADSAVRHVFIDAPKRPVTLNAGMVMHAWYDIIGLKLIDRVDKQGIEQSECLIRDVINKQLIDGFDYRQIFLAGFSQGGAMALHTALNTSERLGGIIALSAYLPLAHETGYNLDKNTPFFIAGGQFDTLVLPAWTEQSKNWLLDHGYTNCAFHQYPMEHSICYEELKDISLWLTNQIKGVVQ